MDFAGYRGKRVVVSGCASGMGLATARMLIALGAEVHGLDLRQAELALASFHQIDLRDPNSIEAAAATLDDGFDALFNCAGVGPTFSPLDIVKVNFIGTRMLTERLLPKFRGGAAIASIASTAGKGWNRRIALHQEFVATEDFPAATAWVQAHSEDIGEGYSFSKEAVIVWTLLQSQDLIQGGIRINCILPGLTHTPMMTDQIAGNTSKDVLDKVMLPMGRPETPEEQAFVLVMMNSPHASFVNGAALNVDGGRLASLIDA